MAVERARKDAREEREMKDAKWSRIAKAVDDAMGSEDPGSIEAGQVTHIVNAILECALPMRFRPQPGVIKAADEEMPVEEHDSSESRRNEVRSKNRSKPSWANVAAQAPNLP